VRLSIASIHKQFADEIENVFLSKELEALKVKYLGKKGPIQDLMKELKTLSPEQRPEIGKCINDLKEEITEQLLTKQQKLIVQEELLQLEQEQIDVTLPGRKQFQGRKHIITKVLDEVLDILMEMGFSVQYGPDVDNDYYNFEALNFPPDHPARDMQDTFYIAPNVLLRTQTSNVQPRVMEMTTPPIRVISPGKAYRNESITARSHVFFHQVEVLYINKGVSFADLFATLDIFLKKLFGETVNIRYRPSYFPFVEPGLEVDISCLACKGEGCYLCKYMEWLEILGAGMVHPEVLSMGGIDPEVYSGYAWGMGIERLAMLKYGISDIRLFTENDLRFLCQFS
jgi:phenylalanyl-tRNA synthetase alpha chain